MEICAVIPAAGRGTRLGLDVPKILAPLSLEDSIWTVLHRKLSTVSDHVHVVLSQEGECVFRRVCATEIATGRVSTSVQPSAIGMGDAVFRGFDVWSKARLVLVIWGDQVFVSKKTLSSMVALYDQAEKTVILPLVSLPEPYVDYVFDANDNLLSVNQSREGDHCRAGGWNDIGTFLLSVDGLKAAWEHYASAAPRGRSTGEINFLPFFPYLAQKGWRVRRLCIADQREARGVNTPEDLRYFRELLTASVPIDVHKPG